MSKTTPSSDPQPSAFKAPPRQPSPHRPLPASLDAEKALLCSIMLCPKENLPMAVERIDRHYFHHPAHATIYELMVDLWNKLKPIDMITLTQALSDKKQLDQVGGASALAQLQTFLPTAALAEHYLDILREKFLLRLRRNVWHILSRDKSAARFPPRGSSRRARIFFPLDALLLPAYLNCRALPSMACKNPPESSKGVVLLPLWERPSHLPTPPKLPS